MIEDEPVNEGGEGMSGRIVEYKMCEADSAVNLNNIVIIYLHEGWKLYGTPFSHDGFICQAMVREERW